MGIQAKNRQEGHTLLLLSLLSSQTYMYILYIYIYCSFVHLLWIVSLDIYRMYIIVCSTLSCGWASAIFCSFVVSWKLKWKMKNARVFECIMHSVWHAMQRKKEYNLHYKVKFLLDSISGAKVPSSCCLDNFIYS